MPNIGTPELIIGLIVIFLLFGAKRMPEMARGIGQSLKIFKSEMSKPADSDASNAVIVNPAPAQPQASTAQASAAQPASAEPATETPAAAPADPEARPAQQ
ncbi:twin-arginine translocase TatA/TatE family subunit [Jiangella sp. DSM 45060]|uniref:twin-arginine translocase TatA/TatE family subunit n=1 Tax=Jiangella sp. DSM 45060 TaxID=1798224 RepID=UPI00087B92EF|nr:twin-arginine translocase TatA/TatE family subunit [Jiangella sp. DSM 45060]SDT64120.1 sec-independent protein translocase protein TatA [Jiangella sp. DSM 45060]